jgi:hypothetical protein
MPFYFVSLECTLISHTHWAPLFLLASYSTRLLLLLDSGVEVIG